jgi:tryptophan synthase beta chain
VHVNDDDALGAFESLSRLEGILPALESSHAIAAAMRMAHDRPAQDVILINLSGRGDKDVVEAQKLLADRASS